MKRSLSLTLILTILTFSSVVSAQKNRSGVKSKTKVVNPTEDGNPAVIIDRRLSVLRTRPSLYAKPIQRMNVGRKVTVIGTEDADGVRFYQVRVAANTIGWVQAEAIIGQFRKDDDLLLFKLIQAASGFDQVNKTMIFLEEFPDSMLRPAILLLLGDLMEEEALKLSTKASDKMDRREMAASGAPLHSFYLNFPGLDRYGKLGVRFLFNISTMSYHYDGDSWFEIVRRFPKSNEAVEAQKRLDTLKEMMEKKK